MAVPLHNPVDVQRSAGLTPIVSFPDPISGSRNTAPPRTNGVHIVSEPIDATQASTTGDARRLVELAAATNTTMSNELLLDTLRRNAQVTTRHIRTDFVEVASATAVLGYVCKQRKEFVALRGDDPAWAHEVGRYPSESLAVEALRMRRG